MIPVRKLSIALLLAFALAGGTALASWYDDYDAGITAANKGQWSTVIQKMSAAISGHPKEGDKERTYGAIFITYHPYYYRGVAYLNTGKFEQAIADFEKTSGPGDTNLGDLTTLMQRAKTKLEAANAPPPEPTPQPQIAQRPAPVPVAPAPVPVPAGPSIDPALRQRVQSAIAAASSSLGNARNRKAAGSPQYSQAVQSLADANTKANTAKSNDELNAALTSAQNASLFADSAMAPGVPSKVPAVSTASTIPPRPVAAAEMALSDYRTQLRNALANYFAGEFDTASRGFESLSKSMPNNGWVWAFLGASRYSQYAFEADDSYKTQAVEAFRRAKTSPNFRKSGLPDKYFSKRIRKFFDTLG
jgi:tetratricopeptide (TPR) repeat protein